ncbi:MAG: DNA polymerase III subunit delta [Eggerthellaceae bacterium]|nr:DNA polymerase III subunit delta [Eggerthellaceae bacterium]
MADVFESVFGQPDVRDFLRKSVLNERVTHAYLFTGPAGSNKTQAAYALAAALMCGERNGCGRCEECERVMRRTHPDVRYFAPEGATGYLVEQVREIVADTALAPIRSTRKVYIMDRVDLLGVSAANAFLKTLEEPPSDVVLILLGRTRESVLPTIVSRCSVVPFRHIPASEAAAIIVQRTGTSRETARMAIEASGGSITAAIDFLKSNERLAFRARVLEMMSLLRRSDSWDLFRMASEVVTLAKAPLDSVRAAQEAELEANSDFLAKSAIRQIEARNKRALSAYSTMSLRQFTAIVASYLRDVLVTCAGTPELVINVDVSSGIADVAGMVDEPRVAKALAAVRAANEAISYNVSPETCIGAMLIEIREALYGSHSPR